MQILMQINENIERELAKLPRIDGPRHSDDVDAFIATIRELNAPLWREYEQADGR